MSSTGNYSTERASDVAYRVIRDAIISGELPKGKRLSKRGMADFCGVSTIPVIDALNRLEAEGLVESNPYTGSRVVDINDDRIGDSYILREAIETQIVRVLCYTAGIDEIWKLREMATKVDALVGKEHEHDSFDDLHFGFHTELAKATRSRSLLESLERIHFFSLLVKGEVKYRNLPEMTTNYSHQDIVESIARRDVDEADRIMRNHIYRSGLVSTPHWVDLHDH